MNMNFDLMELNSLYVATSMQLKRAQKDAEKYPSDIFQTELTIAEMLVEKIQTALYAKVDELESNFSDENGIKLV